MTRLFAARGHQVLLAYWLRTGNHTQLWTTVRNVAALLADRGCHGPAAVLYAAADGAESAAALGPKAAARTRTVRTALAEVLGATDADRVTREDVRMPVGEVARLASDELHRIAGAVKGPRSPPSGRCGWRSCRPVAGRRLR